MVPANWREPLSAKFQTRTVQLSLLGLIILLALVLRCWEFDEIAQATFTVEPDSREKIALSRKIAFDEQTPLHNIPVEGDDTVNHQHHRQSQNDQADAVPKGKFGLGF